MSGTAGEGIQYRQLVDTTRTFMYRHHILTYTGTGVDLHDASGGASFIFAGVIYTSWPYQEQAALYGVTSPFAGTNVSVPPTSDYVTCARNSRNHVIGAETIAQGNLIMPTDVIDEVTLLLETHDGMVSPVATGTSTQVDQAIGFAEASVTVPATNDVHLANWDWDNGHYTTTHPSVVAYIFK